jgi:hypothetical protein
MDLLVSNILLGEIYKLFLYKKNDKVKLMSSTFAKSDLLNLNEESPVKKLLLFTSSLLLVSANLLAQLKIELDTIRMAECEGALNGAIMITVSGGITPYSFRWDGQGLVFYTEDLYNIPSGLYNLTVKDSIGASVEENFIEVSYADPISISFEKSAYGDYQVSCTGCSDGWIKVTDGVGNGDYIDWEYLWSGSKGFTKSGLSVNGLQEAGEYLLEIKDTANCPWSDTIELTQPDAPIYSGTITVWDTIHITVYDSITIYDTVYKFTEAKEEVTFTDPLSEETLTIYNYGDYLLTDKIINSTVIYNILGSEVKRAEQTNKITVSDLDSGKVLKKKIYIK